MIKPILTLLSTMILLAGTALGAPRAFGPDSLESIVKQKEGKAFVLMLWSVECASCMKELDAVAASLKTHPDLDIVLVSTDEATEKEAADTVLAKHGLGKLQSWIFGDVNAQKLRYQIDPSWFGELPRSFFYDRAHQRKAHTGVLGTADLDHWYATNR
jgi:hypothetical protein